MRTRHEIAKACGYTLRSEPNGELFLNEGGDDLMKINNKNEIEVYVYDASAYFVATMIRFAPR